ncbi:hypothetical protein [Ligilactobacillus murinus]|uniref:Uncharacterized protein n=1 Tax=Ligilactobacillus murinus TaxID=1622 RepID=A0AAD0PC72_9LACO|nr:hypothetical protein [Ligilactobacillus murinus]AWZ37852.1 hypothetical protein CPS94_02410 [Ligilactobacillus murinus]AWZ41157.1 hypothetical protein CPQ89_09055 [Ligilactobacillus murinus]
MSGSSEKKDVLCKQVTLIIKKYREKFGEGSLDRCIEFMLDPILPVNSDETLENCILELQHAIKVEKKLEQVPKDIFDKIRF